jgi:lipid A 4'-phosphatase
MTKYLVLLKRFDVIALLGSVILFVVWPQLDMLVATYFYNDQTMTFIGADSRILDIPYEAFAVIHVPVLLGLISYAIYFQVKKNVRLRQNTFFLLCCLIVGPGIFVNGILKDNSVGRPRPRQVVEFGGDFQHVNAFQYSGQCQRNCSFVCGHAAIGFVAIALAWAFRSRKLFVFGTILGGLLGVMRISQGAHFFSDVIFSFWAVYFITLVFAQLFGLTLAYPDSSKKIENPLT